MKKAIKLHELEIHTSLQEIELPVGSEVLSLYSANGKACVVTRQPLSFPKHERRILKFNGSNEYRYSVSSGKYIGTITVSKPVEAGKLMEQYELHLFDLTGENDN